MKGRSLTDLSVIKEQSEILGVKILRPLLSHPKKEIFELAHKTKIPYFKNTTPSWSNRGQYREIIQPAIIKTFGEGVLTNLSKIGKESDEIQLLMNDYIIKPYLNSIMFKDNKYYFIQCKNYNDTILMENLAGFYFLLYEYNLTGILYYNGKLSQRVLDLTTNKIQFINLPFNNLTISNNF